MCAEKPAFALNRLFERPQLLNHLLSLFRRQSGERLIVSVHEYQVSVHVMIRCSGIGVSRLHAKFENWPYLDGSMARAQTADGILDSPRRWFEIATRLRKRGLTDEQIRKVYGGNLLHVYRKVLR